MARGDGGNKRKVLAGLFGFAVTALTACAPTSQSLAARGSSYKPIHLNQAYDHERYVMLPAQETPGSDHIRRFRAYTSLFDGMDDDDGDGDSDLLGVPHFVTYELKAQTGKLKKYKRPSVWITDRPLAQQKIAPWNNTYRYTQVFRKQNPNWYERGHLCTKFHASRLERNADWNTHTLMNAVPQRENFNRGIWYDLEKKIAKWADQYGSVWVIAGPVFKTGDLDKGKHIGEAKNNEVLVAVPESLFKIIVRHGKGRTETLAFIYPQDVGRNPKGTPYDHTLYMTSIDDIERLTGFDFVFPDTRPNGLESKTAKALWPIHQ